MTAKDLVNLYQDAYFELRKLEDKDTSTSIELPDLLYQDLIGQEVARMQAFLGTIETLKQYYISKGINIK